MSSDDDKIEKHIKKVLGDTFKAEEAKNNYAPDNHKLSNFLEIEKLRIKQLKEFFQTRIPNVVELNQFDELMQELVEYNDKLKLQVLKKTMNQDSRLSKNLKQIFNNTFID